MKSRFFFTLFTVIMIISPSLSAQQGAGQPMLADLEAAAAKAGEARSRAGDFSCPSYFPGEWEAAEKQLAETGQMPNNDANIKSTIDAYNALADTFDSILTLTIPLYAQAREDEIMELRDVLIDTGARDSFPEYFIQADEAALLALTQFEAGDYYDARESAANALQLFRYLTIAHDAWVLGWEINEREFALYDPDNFERADEILSGAMDEYNAGDIPAAQENAEEAYLRYSLVLSTGWAEYAEFHSSKADGERQAALDMRTNIAAKEYFLMAEQDYKDAHEQLNGENYEEASKLFINAEAMYVIANMLAQEKRLLARNMLREAHDKIEESGRAARQAEIIIKGGSR